MNVKDALKEAILFLDNIEIKGTANMWHIVAVKERIEIAIEAIEAAEKEVAASNDN